MPKKDSTKSSIPSIAIIRNGKIVYGVPADMPLPTETEANSRRRDMKTAHRKDLLQPNQVDYYKAYPDQAKELGDETRRLLS